MPPPTPQTNMPMGNNENPIDLTKSGSDGGSTLSRHKCTTHGRFSCVPCARVKKAQYARPIVHPADLMKPSSSQEVSLDEKGHIRKASGLYRRVTAWRPIAPDDAHGHGCALVCAGLLPIIGEFFYECQVTVIPENGRHTDGEIQLGRWFATKASLTRFQTEMVNKKKYEVRVSGFGQKRGLSARMTSGRFDYIPLSETPFMAVAVMHLLLYLGSGRDKRSSYRIYHDNRCSSRASEGGIRKYQLLFGMARFPWSPEPRTATTVRMINLAFNDTFPVPDLDRGSPSWRRFCDSPFKDTWEDIRMRHFRYETYEVERQRPARPRDLPPSHTPPGNPPAPASRPSVPPASVPPTPVPPASVPPADAESQMATPVTTTLPFRPAPQGRAPASRDQANGSTPADSLSGGSSGLSGRPFPGPGRIPFGISPFGRVFPSDGGESVLRRSQTTSEGQHTSGQAGPSTAVVRTQESASQGVLGTATYRPRRSGFGEEERSTAPEGGAQNRH